MNTGIADRLCRFTDDLHGTVFIARLKIADAAAFSRGLQTCDSFQQLLLPVAGDTGNAQDLTGIGIEADIVQNLDTLIIVDGQVADLQALDRVHRLGPFDIELDLLADHHLCQRAFGGILGLNAADIFTLSQDSHTV